MMNGFLLTSESMDLLTYSTLWANSADDKFIYLFIYLFSRKWDLNFHVNFLVKRQFA